MEYFNFYYEDFQNEKLNLTDKIILSLINSFNEYEVNYQELNELLGITVSNIKLSIKKLKDLNLVQGNDKLELTNKTQGRYFKVEIEAGFNIKQLLLKYYIVHLPYKAFFGSLDTLSKVLQISKPTITRILTSLVENEKLRKEKYKKCFKYTVIDTPSEEIKVENVFIEEEQQQTIPTADIELLNKRLDKASEVVKQQQQQINNLLEVIEQLKTSMKIQSEKFSNIYKVIEPILDFVQEVNADLSSVYQVIGEERKKCESEYNIKDMRKIFDNL